MIISSKINFHVTWSIQVAAFTSRPAFVDDSSTSHIRVIMMMMRATSKEAAS